MIYFYNGKGELIASGTLFADFDLSLGPTISSATADGLELAECWNLLGRIGTPNRAAHTFLDSDAEELYANWAHPVIERRKPVLTRVG